MRILVAPLNAEIGGTQINSVDLGAAVRDLGHDVVVFCERGPLSELIADRGLRQIVASTSTRLRNPSHAVWVLRDMVKRERIDLVHAYERARSLHAYFAAYVPRGVPVLATILMVAIPRQLPDTMPIVVGTRELLEQARASRAGAVDLLEPPVDTDRDHPGVDGSEFLDAFDLDTTHRNVVIVSRLSPVLKLEGLLAAIEAVSALSEEMPVRLVVVGGGPSRELLEQRAEAANARADRRVVVLTGPLLDPRPAYAAADVVLGMGSSALRGMAFERPTIIVGEGGFSKIFSPETLDEFLHIGFYGFGEDPTYPDLGGQLRLLLTDDAMRGDLGRFSRNVVCERFSLTASARTLEGMYRRMLEDRDPLWTRLTAAAGTGVELLRARIRRRWRPERSRQGRKPSEW